MLALEVMVKLRHGLIGGVLLLAGCGLPPAVVIASYAIDGVSYLTTGKSVTDHALSAVAQQDCALHRVITDSGNVCSQTLSDDELLAFVDDDGLRAADGDVPALVASVGSGRDDEELILADVPTVFGGVTAPVSSDRFLVIGSFANAENAGRLVDDLTTLSAATATVDLDGRTMHRVVVPAEMSGQLADAGISDAWPIELCAGSLTAGPCETDAPVAYLAALPQ